ncbi:MAG: hypothetical protein C4547_04110 [Phycisphaerales bacterium]|nr:MAG: hypothetical protein C4547_04110 [Phycisphaerales bacterium]
MSEQPEPIAVSLDLDEFFRNGKKVQIREDVRRRILARRNATVVDMAAIREQQDWSALKDKVVGAEGA